LTNGVYWDQQTLSQLVNAADLRSPLAIINGDNPINEEGIDGIEFSRRYRPWDFVKVRRITIPTDEHPVGKGIDIMLDDQGLAQLVRAENRGRFDKEAYIRMLNSAVRSGFWDAIQTEKTQASLYAALYGGMEIASVTTLATVSYLLKRVDLHAASYSLDFVNVVYLGVAIKKFIKHQPAAFHHSTPVFQILPDYNPLKQFNDLKRGQRFLQTSKPICYLG